MDKDLVKSEEQEQALDPGRDPRNIVTPFAFEVAPHIFGTPLASAWRRGGALLIDLALLGLLTLVNSAVLAALVAVMFFRAGKKLRKKHKRPKLQALLRLGTAFMVFIVAISLFEIFSDESQSRTVNSDGKQFTNQESLQLVGLLTKHGISLSSTSAGIKTGKCAPAYDCWQDPTNELAKDLAEFEATFEEAEAGFRVVAKIANETLNEDEIAQLNSAFMAKYKGELPESKDNLAQDTDATTEMSVGPETQPLIATPLQAASEEGYSIVKWLEGVAADLGIGFGWAAFYFTALTTWLNGQTPGKKIFGIKIIKLDGSAPNLWESFGRYGGYGAGLATGLLGFLQIFWDPNRQAIQDKISETLVIKVTRSEKQAGD